MNDSQKLSIIREAFENALAGRMPEQIIAGLSECLDYEKGAPPSITHHTTWSVLNTGGQVVGAEYVRADLVAEKDAEIERLRTLILAFVNGVDEYDHNGRQRDEEFRDIFSSLAKTGAAYLRERGSRPPTGGEA
jgi:hypothetical protein